MAVTNAQAAFGLSASGDHSKPWVAGDVIIGRTVFNFQMPEATIAFSASLRLLTDSSSATLDLTDFAAAAVIEPGIAASYTTALPTANSNITYTAVPTGEIGNSISIQYQNPVLTSYLVGVTVLDQNITVTPSAKGRMLVTANPDITPGSLGNTATGQIVFPPLLYFGQFNGKPYFQNNLMGTYKIQWDSTNLKWIASAVVSGRTDPAGNGTFYWESTDNVDSPDLVTTWTVVSPMEGVIQVEAAISNANQVISGVISTAESVALVGATLASGNDGTGAVSVMAPEFLTGGVNPSGWIGAALDYEGEAFKEATTILGVLVQCISGRLRVYNTTNEPDFVLSQNQFFQIASMDATGIDYLPDTLTFESLADNTQILICVLAK